MEEAIIEAKFTDVDIPSATKILQRTGKQIHPAQLYERSYLNSPRGDAIIISKDRATGITATIADSPAEVAFACDIKSIIGFFSELGCKFITYHQIMCEKWKIGKSCVVIIVNIPGIPAFLQVFCDSRETLAQTSDTLGLQLQDAKMDYGAQQLYEDYYGVTEGELAHEIKQLTFEGIGQDIGKFLKKNPQLLMQVVREQLSIYSKIRKA